MKVAPGFLTSCDDCIESLYLEEVVYLDLGDFDSHSA